MLSAPSLALRRVLAVGSLCYAESASGTSAASQTAAEASQGLQYLKTLVPVAPAAVAANPWIYGGRVVGFFWSRMVPN